MDEPFSSLDVHSREEMMDDFEKIARKSGSSVLFVSHDRFETLRLADRIIVLQNGRMLQHGNPNEIINKPADAFAASFMGVENLLIARVKEVFDTGFVAEIRGSTIEVAAHAAPNETVTLGIRPENVVISKTPSASSMRNTFPGKVTDISAAGIHARVTVDCGFRLIAYITPHSVNELALVRGSEISASFKATAIHVFRHSPLKTDITTS
jgi:tungstate transport system ATP-binding protein